jgi:hypothetical protein
MSKAAVSSLVFGIYAICLGSICILFTNSFLKFFGFPTTEEVWFKVMGMLILHYGTYFILAARNELDKFFRWSVYPRSSVIIFLLVFVLAGLVKPIILLFGVIDLLAGLWTFFALRSKAN